MEASQTQQLLDVVVIGAGPAGIGVGVALRHAGIDNFVIVDRLMIGASFMLWPAETRLITPSFPTNSIGMLDLNAIALGTSPAFILEAEHPTGEAYAIYLNAVAKHYELPVRTKVDVANIEKVDGVFHIHSTSGVLRAKHVIWAAGEYQYPRLGGFDGAKLCTHTATLERYSDLSGDNFVIIGGYESGIDAAYHLALSGKRSRVLDEGSPWESTSSDPSISLSTYSIERMRSSVFTEHVELVAYSKVSLVRQQQTEPAYHVTTHDGRVFESHAAPLDARGFVGGHGLIGSLFEMRGDGFPHLTEHDESTQTPGLYMCGPGVRHDNHVFCFIFKYRQRFAIVAKAIATAMGNPAKGLDKYRTWGMYLDDLSCCGEECIC